jgi:hypothetical protein
MAQNFNTLSYLHFLLFSTCHYLINVSCFSVYYMVINHHNNVPVFQLIQIQVLYQEAFVWLMTRPDSSENMCQKIIKKL